MPVTISEKWELMLASFADIKAAIEEKGVTVSGGYNSYANGVRSIYGGTAEDVIEYPEKSLFLMSTIFGQLSFCVAVKERIRQAIIDGGVECDTSVPLSGYSDKIHEIAAEELEIVTSSLPNAEYGIPYTARFEAKGGKAPYTWKLYRGSVYGLKFNSDGTVTGTPTQPARYTIYMKCTDNAGNSVTKKCGIYVAKQTVSLSVVGQKTFEFDGEPHSLTVVCSNPNAQFTMRYGADRTETVIGSPYTTSQYAGHVVFNPNYYEVDDSINRVYITIIPPTNLTIATLSLPDATFNTPYTAQLDAVSGVTPYAWSRTNTALANELVLSEDGKIEGTPTATGTYKNIGVKCIDSAGTAVERTYSLKIQPKTVSFTLVGDNHFTYDGEPHTLTFTCSEPDVDYDVLYGADEADSLTEQGTAIVRVRVNTAGYVIDSDTEYFRIYVD